MRAFTAVAGTDALVTVLSKGSLVELLASIPTVSKNFIRLLSKRLAKVEKEFGDFGHTWSYDRLSKILLQLCEEHGKETPKGTVIPLRLTHEDLANLIGTTRETVTTQMIRFRRMGLVSARTASSSSTSLDSRSSAAPDPRPPPPRAGQGFPAYPPLRKYSALFDLSQTFSPLLVILRSEGRRWPP